MHKEKIALLLLLICSSCSSFKRETASMSNEVYLKNIDDNLFSKKVLLRSVVLSMGKDAPRITDERYNSLFKENNASIGIASIIANKKFYINKIAIPANEADYNKNNPNGFLVNQLPWLIYDAKNSTWKGGYKADKMASNFQEAALLTATGIVAGLEVRLYDTNQSGFADLIEADFKEGAVAKKIIRNRDNTISIYRGDIDLSNKTSTEGRIFDGEHFTLTSNEKIKVKNFDPAINSNDVFLFWASVDGWHVERAKEARGSFIDGEDHKNYNIGGVIYQDAMRFSRDNIYISNRPGEFVSAQKYFGLNKLDDGYDVSLWLVPTTDKDAQGAPISITTNENSKRFLAKAIEFSEIKLKSVAVSEDGSDVSSDKYWVTQITYNQLSNAIKRAKENLSQNENNFFLLDYQTYLLYLNLEGSDGDIGAKFGGFKYVGFNKQIQSGKLK